MRTGTCRGFPPDPSLHEERVGRILRPTRPGQLLVGDAGASSLQSLSGLVCGLLVDLLQHGLGGSLNQVLGLLETEAGERAHLLDHLDLLIAGSLEDDVDLVAGLFLCRGRLAAAGGWSCGGDRYRSGCGHPECGLEFLDELTELDQGQLLESVKELGSAELRHDWASFLVVFRSRCCQWFCHGPLARFLCSC